MSKKLIYLVCVVLVLGLATGLASAADEIWREAELADSITEPMVIYEDDQASGGQSIGPVAGSGDSNNDPTDGIATYTFRAKGGTYKIFCRVSFITGVDSFWFRIPGWSSDQISRTDGWVKWNNVPILNSGYFWAQVFNDDMAGDPVLEFKLSAGTHTLEIARRERNVRIDAFWITDNLALDGATLPDQLPPVPGPKATQPNPAADATDVPRDVVISWTPGDFANTHDVYLGTVFDDVSDADISDQRGVLVSQGQIAATYDPGRLDFGQTYFWRVDEVNAPPTSQVVFRGDVWSFTVEPFAYPIENVTATASSANRTDEGPENTVNGSGLDDSGLLHGNIGIDNMWLSNFVDPDRAWIQYEFDRIHKLYQMWVWNYNGSVEPIIGFGIKEATIEYSVDGTNWAILGTTHEFARGSGSAGYAPNTTVDLSGVSAKYVKITANSNWGGMVNQYGLSEVRFFYIPVLAREPNPDSGATDVPLDVSLSFRAGREAAHHDLYLSTDEQAVIAGTADVTAVTETSYGPLSLDLDKTYYWRVDEVNEAEVPTTWQGEIWDFVTQEYLIVEDFEDYDDYEPNRVFDTWTDGWGVATNGSTMGYPDPIFVLGEHFVETTIVHGGSQSAPLFYDNTAGATYSEVTRTVDAPRDWTMAGIQALVLYFHGSPGNTGQLYVKINGFKVVYPGDAADMTRLRWKQWGIDLASLGTDLQNVTTLSIGIDGNGASGTLYFDDIGLYPSVPEASALEIWFEAEAADSITEPMKIYPAAGVDPVADAGGKGAPSGGSYIGTTSDVPGNTNSPGTQDIATYTFTVPAAGTYAIWGRVSNIFDDSFWVNIPDGQYDVPVYSSGWIQWNGIEPETADWHWVRVFSQNAANAVVNVTLTAGEHTILWAHRESQNFLDAFVISKID